MPRTRTSEFWINRYRDKRGAARVQVMGSPEEWKAAGLPDPHETSPNKLGAERWCWRGTEEEAAPLEAAIEAYEADLADQAPVGMRDWYTGPEIDGLTRRYILEWLHSMAGKSVRLTSLRGTLGIHSKAERELLWRLMVQDHWIEIKDNKTILAPHGAQEAVLCMEMLDMYPLTPNVGPGTSRAGLSG